MAYTHLSFPVQRAEALLPGQMRRRAAAKPGQPPYGAGMVLVRYHDRDGFLTAPNANLPSQWGGASCKCWSLCFGGCPRVRNRRMRPPQQAPAPGPSPSPSPSKPTAFPKGAHATHPPARAPSQQRGHAAQPLLGSLSLCWVLHAPPGHELPAGRDPCCAPGRRLCSQPLLAPVDNTWPFRAPCPSPGTSPGRHPS